MVHITTLAAFASGFAALVNAHPSAEHEHTHVHSRDLSHCSNQIAKRQAKRHANMVKRTLERTSTNGITPRSIYPEMLNTSCATTPEVTQGPYFIDGELYRYDIREEQEGVDMYFDIGLVDVETCEPLPDAYVDFWHCNATGYYSGYTGISPDDMSLIDGFEKRADGTTDDLTFLRGFQKSNDEGIVEFLSIFPGFYQPRALHIHLIVHQNASLADNGTLSGGNSVATSQIFFDEELSTNMLNLEPYSQHDQAKRTANDDDMVFPESSVNGYWPVASWEQLGENLADGIVGYITVGVNRSAVSGGSGSGGSAPPTDNSASASVVLPSGAASDVPATSVVASGTGAVPSGGPPSGMPSGGMGGGGGGGGAGNSVPTASIVEGAYASASARDVTAQKNAATIVASLQPVSTNSAAVAAVQS